MIKKQLFVSLLALPLLAQAQNPVIRDQFAADPTARVFNNKVYLYPSHDIFPPKDSVRTGSVWRTTMCFHPRT